MTSRDNNSDRNTAHISSEKILEAEQDHSPGLLHRTTIHSGRVVNLSIDRVLLPNKKEVSLEMVCHPGAAAMVPIDDKNGIYLVRQYRYATGGFIYEVPAGKLDDNEDPAECARRELVEEIGMQAGKLVSMGWIWTSPGFSNEKIHLFLAMNLKDDKQALEENEVLTVQRMDMNTAFEMARSGEITDSKTICGLMRAESFLQKITRPC